MGAYFIGLPPRLRNNCAEPVYNFKSDDIESITQERGRDTADRSGGERCRIRSTNSLTEHRKPEQRYKLRRKKYAP